MTGVVVIMRIARRRLGRGGFRLLQSPSKLALETFDMDLLAVVLGRSWRHFVHQVCATALVGGESRCGQCKMRSAAAFMRGSSAMARKTHNSSVQGIIRSILANLEKFCKSRFYR